MPKDSTPRSFAFLILKPPGSTAPTLATGTFMPPATFLAPQTICTGSPSPRLTRHTESLSASGWRSHASTSPTTTPLNSGAAGSTLSTSRPAMLRASVSSPVLTPGSTQSRSQASLNCIALFLVQIDVHHGDPNRRSGFSPTDYVADFNAFTGPVGNPSWRGRRAYIPVGSAAAFLLCNPCFAGKSSLAIPGKAFANCESPLGFRFGSPLLPKPRQEGFPTGLPTLSCDSSG